MLSTALFIKYFSSLFAIVNPFGGIALFLSITDGTTPNQRRRIARVCGVAVLCILSVVTVMGQQILNFFSISIPAFQVGGGLILILLALSMLQATRSEMRGNKAERREAEEKENVAIFPLAMPFFAGPGSFTLTILTAHDNYSIVGLSTMLLAIFLVALSVVAALYFSTPLSEKLGTTGLNIITRVMGIILTAFAVEMIAAGLTGLFPVLSS